MKVETMQEPNLYTITLTGLTTEQRDRVNQFAQGLNGTQTNSASQLIRRARRVATTKPNLPKAAKRGVGRPVKKNSKSKMIECPVGHEAIKSQGSIQHVRAHGRRENLSPEQLNAAIDALKSKP